jgi:hypothetical protein
MSVPRPWLPITIALAAAAAQAAGAPTLALYVLLAAVPVNAACALGALGDLLDARAKGPVGPVIALEPALAGLALVLVVAGTAANAVVFALTGCLAVYLVQALLGLGAELRAVEPSPRSSPGL